MRAYRGILARKPGHLRTRSRSSKYHGSDHRHKTIDGFAHTVIVPMSIIQITGLFTLRLVTVRVPRMTGRGRSVRQPSVSRESRRWS